MCSFVFSDSEGDLVSLSGENDLKVAIAATEKGQLLRVVVQGRSPQFKLAL